MRRAFTYILIRFIQLMRVLVYRYMLSDNSATLFCVRLNQPAQFVGRGRISLTKVTVGVWPSPGFLNSYAYFEARGVGSRIEVGAGTFFNNAAVIIADRSTISIGNNCLIGVGFFAVDSDFHGLELENRSNGNYECSSVIIGDDVFIGNDVKVLKGVKIGNGAVIGSGSIVLSDVPDRAIFAGIPARLIRYI